MGNRHVAIGAAEGQLATMLQDRFARRAAAPAGPGRREDHRTVSGRIRRPMPGATAIQFIPFPTEPARTGDCSACSWSSPAFACGISDIRGPRSAVQAQRITSAGDLRSWLGASSTGCDAIEGGGPGPLSGIASMARGEAWQVGCQRRGPGGVIDLLMAGLLALRESAGDCGPARQMGRSLLRWS